MAASGEKQLKIIGINNQNGVSGVGNQWRKRNGGGTRWHAHRLRHHVRVRTAQQRRVSHSHRGITLRALMKIMWRQRNGETGDNGNKSAYQRLA